MTLITTVIGKYGVIQASDSNLTVNNSQTRTGTKLFRLGFNQAILALAGTYKVGTELMDTWIPSAAQDYSAAPNPSMEGFANYVARRLAQETTGGQQDDGTLMHIAGYAIGDNGAPHPEMWFVRNLEAIDPTTGNYLNPSINYQVSEEFWTKDYKRVTPGVAGPEVWRYFNGTAPGRVAFLQLGPVIESFFRQIRERPDWKFREPNSLSELAEVVRIQMEIITTMFRVSDYNVPAIGGPIQLEEIHPPSDAVDL